MCVSASVSVDNLPGVYMRTSAVVFYMHAQPGVTEAGLHMAILTELKILRIPTGLVKTPQTIFPVAESLML